MDPKTDGIDHINVYMKGRTTFGRFFSNLQTTPIKLGSLGEFQCIEGLWFYLGFQDERFHKASGYDCKSLSKELLKTQEKSIVPPEIFKYIISQGIIQKAKKHGGLKLCLESPNLPLKHYYTYGSEEKGYKVIDLTDKYQWWLDVIDNVRKKVNDNNNNK